ncbi:MAG TPA: ATP-dependent helicase, partial [Mycobacterium sp.]|nr:ATP-dependent helicase [Mycobacterium sp.]
VHVDGVELVVHVDPPMEHKAYLHRSGRTARAGSDGDVVTVVLPEQRRDTQQLLRRAGITVRPQEVTADSAPVHALVGEIAPFRTPAPKAVAPVPKTAGPRNDRGADQHRRGGSARGAHGGNRRRGTRGAGARGRAQAGS